MEKMYYVWREPVFAGYQDGFDLPTEGCFIHMEAIKPDGPMISIKELDRAVLLIKKNFAERCFAKLRELRRSADKQEALVIFEEFLTGEVAKTNPHPGTK